MLGNKSCTKQRNLLTRSTVGLPISNASRPSHFVDAQVLYFSESLKCTRRRRSYVPFKGEAEENLALQRKIWTRILLDFPLCFTEVKYRGKVHSNSNMGTFS